MLQKAQVTSSAVCGSGLCAYEYRYAGPLLAHTAIPELRPSYCGYSPVL
jgi:hypothetical protein